MFIFVETIAIVLKLKTIQMKKIKLNLDKSDAKKLLRIVKFSRTKDWKVQRMIETLLSEQLEMLNE